MDWGLSTLVRGYLFPLSGYLAVVVSIPDNVYGAHTEGIRSRKKTPP